MDNLNTHAIGSFYETFSPEEALRLSNRLDIHYTPKHGSWLNIAEIELSALTGQCLDRRIPDIKTMRREVAAWQNNRNNKFTKIDWQFTTSDARIKLKRLFIQSILMIQSTSLKSRSRVNIFCKTPLTA
jgi:hypothetical protein